MQYFEEARQIWSEQVPASGQSETVQGELLRGVEKLRWEAQTNGNINWSGQFAGFATWIEQTLIESGPFDGDALTEIRTDLDRLRDFDHPETDDAPYDRLTDRVVEWSRAQTGPIPRQHDPGRLI